MFCIGGKELWWVEGREISRVLVYGYSDMRITLIFVCLFIMINFDWVEMCAVSYDFDTKLS